MKLWLLRPIAWGKEGESVEVGPWKPWYDKCFGFVVRAESEEEARKIADENGHNENDEKGEEKHPWLNAKYSVCEILKPEGNPGIIIEDAWKA